MLRPQWMVAECWLTDNPLLLDVGGVLTLLSVASKEFIKKEPKPTLNRDGAVNFRIWYDMILFAQNRGPKAELQCTIWDKKGKNTEWPETKLKIQQ